MIWHRPVGPICWPFDSCSRGTKRPEFIQYVDGRKPQMHEIWCLGSDGITHELHPKAQVYVNAGNVGQFSTNYLSKNSRRIPFLGQSSINGSVNLLGIPNFRRTSGPMFIENLLAPYDTTGWGDSGTPIRTGPLSRRYLTACGVFHGLLPYLPVLLTCPGVRTMRALLRAAARRVRDDSLCSRHLVIMRSPSTNHNHIGI